MKPSHPHRSRLAVIAATLPWLALAACTQPGSPTPGATAAGNSQADAAVDTDATSGLPKVPFGNKPCQTLTQEDQKNLGIHAPAPGAASRTPDRLPYDNTCSYEPGVGALAIEYTTRQDFEYQRDNLRKASHTAPADLPGSFYDVLGNLWFAKDGYYVVVTNVGLTASIERTAAVIAAKL